MSEPDECARLSEPSITQFIASCALMIWLLLCYLPQWSRIISRQSAEGLSALYILLGSLSGVCAIGNVMMLPSSAVDLGCCRSTNVTLFGCVSGLLGVLQVVFGIGCFCVVMLMYVYYSREEAEAEIHGRRPSISGPERTFRRARRAWIILFGACGFALAVLVISAIILRHFRPLSQSWANVLGIAVAIFACVRWIPQIYTTWHLGHLGSLSALGLCLQAPYTWAFSISMIARFGLVNWSAWVVYVLVGVMQVVLIAFAAIFAFRGRQDRKEDGSATSEHFDVRKAVTRPRGMSDLSHATLISNVAADERRPLLSYLQE